MRARSLRLRGGVAALLLLVGAGSWAGCKPPPPEAYTACVEQPTSLAKAPSGQLPCELLPPGFSR